VITCPGPLLDQPRRLKMSTAITTHRPSRESRPLDQLEWQYLQIMVAQSARPSKCNHSHDEWAPMNRMKGTSNPSHMRYQQMDIRNLLVPQASIVGQHPMFLHVPVGLQKNRGPAPRPHLSMRMTGHDNMLELLQRTILKMQTLGLLLPTSRRRATLGCRLS
jgi:hypothetical protein